MAEILLEVKDLKKYFKAGSKIQLFKKPFYEKYYLHAVDHISFSIEKGTTLGLVGESGCGKTTVGRTILRLYEADGGEVLYEGKDIAHIPISSDKTYTKKIQMVFQDPYASLDPRCTIADIIGEGIEVHGLYKTKKEREERVCELLEMVGLNREHRNRFPHEFSGGQRQRVGIARALSVNPEFIVCDEAISALDVSIQAQIINLLMRLQKEMGLTYLFIAHDLSMVRHISDQTAVMYLGTIVEIGPTEEVYQNPSHPYTRGLLASVPLPDPDYEAKRTVRGMKVEINSPINPKPGCRFADRCEFACDICREKMPELKDLGKGHKVACHFTEKLNSKE